ncbi:MAG TPA: GNAT family N-acetyltransferase [Candidatus Dormibacteraeota bacterium]|nr:GNAT family N-acetyltransferase [Candidatus Dormibacteraeota bacterium]
MTPPAVRVVTAGDLDDLLPLMRAYCDFYEVAPADADLLGLARACLADPLREGVQFLARRGSEAVGFSTVFWSWATTEGGRVGVMHDLYVLPAARGTGVADRLVQACVARCRARGAGRLLWQTAPDNLRAQAVYRRLGATREEWVDYWLDTAGERPGSL